MEAFPHLQETTGEQWNIGNLQGAEDTFFLKKKHVCFFFRDLAILRYTNSTRCGFMSTFVSLLNLCLDYFQVESCKLQWVPFLSSWVKHKNCRQSSNSIKFLKWSENSQRNILATKNTLLGYEKNWSHPVSPVIIKFYGFYVFVVKDGHILHHLNEGSPHPKQNGSFKTPKLQVWGEILFQHISMWAKKMSQPCWYTLSHVSFLLFVDHHFRGPHVCRVRLQRFCGR